MRYAVIQSEQHIGMFTINMISSYGVAAAPFLSFAFEAEILVCAPFLVAVDVCAAVVGVDVSPSLVRVVDVSPPWVGEVDASPSSVGEVDGFLSLVGVDVLQSLAEVDAFLSVGDWAVAVLLPLVAFATFDIIGLTLSLKLVANGLFPWPLNRKPLIELPPSEIS